MHLTDMRLAGLERHEEAPTMGVSIVICCHNSALRLPETLRHLAKLEARPAAPWELIVVDHNSTDGTPQLAQDLWPDKAPARLRVVNEPRTGLANARERGLREAQYDIVSFLDDDNWVEPGWVEAIIEVMSRHPDVAAVGGHCAPACETVAPDWFTRHQLGYAIGPQGKQPGDITDERTLWGAGLTLRKAAWEKLVADGFQHLLQGGPHLGAMACEDNELGLALRMSGWRAWYEPRMQLRHFVPADRLTWDHLRRKERRGGRSGPGLDPYHFAMKPPRRGVMLLLRRLRETWQWQFLATLVRIARHPRRLLRFLFGAREGDDEVLIVETQVGRLEGLLRIRRAYREHIRQVRAATWWEVRRAATAPERGSATGCAVEQSPRSA